MARITDSKEKTLAAAARLFTEQGYHGTALHDILAAGGAPRGSLYFHFPRGKEEIGEAALAASSAVVSAFIAETLARAVSLEDFVRGLARGMAANLEASDFRAGCPIATTALETAAQSDALGRAARDAFGGWRDQIARGLVQFGAPASGAEGLATMVLSQLEGALLLARTLRNIAPMRHAEGAVALLVRGG